MLAVAGLVKTFASPEATGGRLPVVQVADFHLQAGEQVALVGTSGAGKTTFLHLLAGILTADEGAITYTLNGAATEIMALKEAQRDRFRGQHIGYIFQTHHLLPGLTALENVQLGMSFTGRAASAEWARHLLEAVGLGERMKYKPGKLSVGQQQRVAVARAVSNRPQIVLADEPTGSLDAPNAAATLELIRRLCGETGAALLLVTHDARIAGRLQRQVRWEELSQARVPARVDPPEEARP